MNKTYQKQNNNKGRKYNKLFGNTLSESLISITRPQRIATFVFRHKIRYFAPKVVAGQQVCRFVDAFVVNAVSQSSPPSVILSIFSRSPLSAQLLRVDGLKFSKIYIHRRTSAPVISLVAGHLHSKTLLLRSEDYISSILFLVNSFVISVEKVCYVSQIQSVRFR